jgi:hypothetical protein
VRKGEVLQEKEYRTYNKKKRKKWIDVKGRRGKRCKQVIG